MTRTMRGRRSALPSLLVAAMMTFAVAGASVASAPHAVADPLSAAKAKATALQKQVTQLQLQAEQASEKYDAVEAKLGALVDEQHRAGEQLDAAQRELDSKRSVVNERVRALYMSGGTLTLYASLLGNSDPARMFMGLQDVASLSHADHQALAGIDSATQEAKQAQSQVDTLLEQQARLMSEATAASDDVSAALARQQQALADADQQVRTIEADIQAQVDAQAAARAAATLLAARQAALTAGYVAGPIDPIAQVAIAAAGTQLGKPYLYGGSGPDEWDCSGLTEWAYRQAGVSLPRTAAEQYAAVPTKVPLGQLAPGDLLFWATDPADPASIHHVAIYLGDGRMLAAPHTGTVVQIQPVYLDGYFGAVRPA